MRTIARAIAAALLCGLVGMGGHARADDPPPPESGTSAPPPVAGASAESSPVAEPPATGSHHSVDLSPATEPAAPAKPHSRERRKHPYGLLLGGVISFLLPYLTIVGVGAHYADYNPNASRVGYIPLAGPFLARGRMSDKDLNDGFSGGLIADGVLQAATAALIVAGAIWCGVGERRHTPERASLRPLLGISAHQASLGLSVRF